MWKNTQFILANLVMPIIVGIVLANIGDAGCVYYGHLLRYAPCWLVNFVVGGFITALVLDMIIYVIWPRIKNRSNESGANKTNDQIIEQANISNTSVKTTPAIGVFSVQLDKKTKGMRKISSPGIVFLNNIKRYPPFLGIDPSQSIITLQYETYITEHFFAKEFVKGVQGGEKYTVKQTDTLDKLALSKYGNKIYSDTIKAKNGITSLTPGQTIVFPYININNPSLPEKDVTEKMSIANPQWIKDKLKPLKLNLTDDEIIPLIEAIYYAAQKARVTKSPANIA